MFIRVECISDQVIEPKSGFPDLIRGHQMRFPNGPPTCRGATDYVRCAQCLLVGRCLNEVGKRHQPASVPKVVNQ
jgi:hypothetical protein